MGVCRNWQGDCHQICKKRSKRIIIHYDVSDEQRVHETTQEIINRYGKIDILVNNAGLCRMWKPFVETTSDELKKRLRVNILRFDVFYT